MKKALRIIFITLGVILLILVFMLLTPFIFREKFAEIVKSTANKSLRTEMNFSSMEVSFFRHFPNLTISLNDFSLKSSAPFTMDTLVRAKDISFGVNLASLLRGPFKINKVFLNKGNVLLQYNEKGASSFDVYNSSADSSSKSDTASKNFSLQIEDISFINTDFTYSDASIPMKIIAHGINYQGKSDLNQAILKLRSKVRIDSLDVIYNGVSYLRSKPVKAQLATSINLNSLDMKFEKNDLVIKDIPFEFKGEMSFRKDGYSFFISLFSMWDDKYASASLWLVNTKTMWLSAKADINLNLANWAKYLGIQDVVPAGLLTLKMKAEGEYRTGQNPDSKTPDTIMLSIPDFTFTSTLTNGSFRYTKYPQALSDISFDLRASATNHDYRTIVVQLENLRAGFMKNKIEGYFRLRGLKDFPVESHFTTRMNMAELKQVVPLDSMDLRGILDIDLDIKGNYAPEKKLFPVAQVSVKLKDGSIKTKYYPRPVENINITAFVTNNTGKLSDTRIKLVPASFAFEGNPFSLTADIADPDNVNYDIVSTGSIDIASIYRVFSQKGMDLKGYIATDLKLKGRQSDAMSGHIEKLRNSGKLILRDIAFSSTYLPMPWIVKSGVFRFDNDQIWFEKFDSRYGASDITLDGHLSNVVNYYLANNQTLKGSFNFHSNSLLLDEFMAEEKESPPAANPAPQPTGVIIIPDNLEIGLKSDLKKISFRKLDISDLSANVEIKKGMVLLKGMKFGLIGCQVGMEATYGSINPNQAYFDFHVNADNFDIKRAYNEVELFRNLSASAGKCEGIVSLDYSLKGRIVGGMNPVYPSLEGGGTLTLTKVKVMGLKLFTAMSKNLDKEKIKDPDLTKVELKTTIKNSVITLEKTKMKISGFRFRVAGETSFDGQLNLKTRLGLPPLGIIGIPIRVLGTQDNPKFKYGRGNNDEDVQETQYSDEIPKDMLEKIKSSKEEELKDEPPQ